MEKYRFPRGSEWRKWDLHAHSPLDHEWASRADLSKKSERTQFAARFVRRAVEAELAVVAITDHNFCRKAEDVIIPEIRERAAESGVVVLPRTRDSDVDLALEALHDAE